MHVNLNCFDYTKLLSGLVEHYNLEDNLNDESVDRIFRNLSDLYTRNTNDTLSQEEIEMVESFLGLTISFITFEGEEFVGIQKQIDNGLELLQHTLTQLLDEIPYGAFSEKYIYGKFLTLPETDEPDLDYLEQIQQFTEYFDNTVYRYIESKSINKLGPGEIFILGEIEKYTHPCEVVVDINVLDRPGTKVKYGNSLITFPIILLEVTGDQ